MLSSVLLRFNLCLADSKSGKYPGWPILSVDLSYLVQEGLDRIQAPAFQYADNDGAVVVLLDEFNEMGRDRGRAEELLSRFLTTARALSKSRKTHISGKTKAR